MSTYYKNKAKHESEATAHTYVPAPIHHEKFAHPIRSIVVVFQFPNELSAHKVVPYNQLSDARAVVFAHLVLPVSYY